MSVTSLISNAYFHSHVVAREHEQVSGTQLFDGLRLLNILLTKQNSSSSYIPYKTDFTFNSVKGQEKYFIDGLLTVNVATFLLSGVVYPVLIETEVPYKNRSRLAALSALPAFLLPQRTKGGTNIYLYPQPSEDYIFNLNATFFLTKVDLSTDIDELLDDYYLSFLEYGLAELICIFNGVPLPPELQATVNEYKHDIKDLPGIDLTSKKINLLSRSRRDMPTNGYPSINDGFRSRH